MDDTPTLTMTQKKLGISMVIIFIAVLGYYLFSRTTFFPFSRGLENAIKDTSYIVPAGVENPHLNTVLLCDMSTTECADANLVLTGFQEDYPNDISITYGHFPTTQNGRNAAIATLVAGTFTNPLIYQDMLYDYHNEWYDLEDPTNYFISIAEEIGIDVEQFTEAYNAALSPDSDLSKSLDSATKKLQQLDVTQPNTVFVNNKKLEQPLSYFALRELLLDEYPEDFLFDATQETDLDFEMTDHEFIDEPFDASGAEEEPDQE